MQYLSPVTDILFDSHISQRCSNIFRSAGSGQQRARAIWALGPPLYINYETPLIVKHKSFEMSFLKPYLYFPIEINSWVKTKVINNPD